MTKAVYDKGNRATDIFDYADKAALLKDDSTGKYYKMMIRENGLWIVPMEMERKEEA